MFEACKSGKAKIVQLLLEHSATTELNTRDLLIELNARDQYGGTAFMWACLNGHKYVVQLLLDHSKRIDLNARSNNGNTAFIMAYKNGHKDIIKLLLEHSDIDITGYKSLTQEMIDFIELYQLKLSWN